MLREHPEFSASEIPAHWIDEAMRDIKDRIPPGYLPMFMLYEKKLRDGLAEYIAETLSRPLAQHMVAEKVVAEMVYRDVVVEMDSVADLRRALAEGANNLRQQF